MECVQMCTQRLCKEWALLVPAAGTDPSTPAHGLQAGISAQPASAWATGCYWRPGVNGLILRSFVGTGGDWAGSCPGPGASTCKSSGGASP